jgi:hypothetical protein
MIAKGILDWMKAPMTPKGNLDFEDWREARRKSVRFLSVRGSIRSRTGLRFIC